jgi:CheY-like chemotaxis protein
MKLLIVDDNASVRRLIRSILANRAHEIHECADGVDALTAYTELHPDFVLMDISMKGLDGITATRQIKAAHPGARVIIVTDYDEAPLREAARVAGACGYVLKENLFDVDRLLDGYRDSSS